MYDDVVDIGTGWRRCSGRVSDFVGASIAFAFARVEGGRFSVGASNFPTISGLRGRSCQVMKPDPAVCAIIQPQQIQRGMCAVPGGWNG